MSLDQTDEGGTKPHQEDTDDYLIKKVSKITSEMKNNQYILDKNRFRNGVTLMSIYFDY